MKGDYHAPHTRSDEEVTVGGAAGRLRPSVGADVGRYVFALAGGGGGGGQQRGAVVEEGLPAVLSRVDHVVGRLPLEEAEAGRAGGETGPRSRCGVRGLL